MILGVRSSGGEGATLFSPFVSFFGVFPRDAERGLRNIAILLEVEWDSSLFWNSTPLARTHLWVLSILLNTSVVSFTLSLTWPGLFFSTPCWIMLRALANFSIFSFCSLWSWRTSFHRSAPGEAPKSTFPTVFKFASINLFTSASCVEERVGIVGNRCTLGPKTYPSSLRPNLRLAGPGILGQTGLARSNTCSDTCVQYALRYQGAEGAGSWSRMAHHLSRARLTSASPPRGSGKTPLSDEALPVRFHTETIVWTVLGHRLQRLCSVPQEILYTSSFWFLFKRPGIDPFIGHLSRTGKMPVYIASCIYSPIHPAVQPPWPEGRLLSLPTRPFWHSQEKDFVKITVQGEEHY